MRREENHSNGGSGCPRCRRLERTIERLQSQIDELRRRLDEAERAQKRQAAPFSKGEPKKDPKKPGRKPGADYGKHACRPRPEKIDKVVDVPLEETCCPRCGGELGDEYVHEQFVTDIPRVEPTVTQFNVHCACCSECGRRVQGRHPEQISDALGAAANQIGPNTLAFAVDLNKSMGASDGKIAKFFRDAYLLSLNRSTLRRAFLRTARKAEPLFERLNIIVRNSPVVYGDETGWKVAGYKEWLWTFVSLQDRATVYVIEPSRAFEVAEAVLGADFAGILGRDGWKPYDNFVRAVQQLCLGHPLRRCDKLIELNCGGAVRFPRDVKALLKDAFALRDLRDEGRLTRRTFLNRAADLEWRLDELLATNFSNNENRKLAAHLLEQRNHIFTFLYHPEIEGTNWPAEQAIRPAVVNRKMSAGNRSRRGAWAQAVLMSVLRTAWQRGLDAVGLFVDLLRSPDPQSFAMQALGP